ncbi:MAG TPA: glycoside hydrolase family 20 zincin-like fold domain-containing protein, partial [Tahibacter sp.]|nr:glycoside hydrolase family 20 zincin-like fold domain-containing protein [Tahibacter sp.]
MKYACAFVALAVTCLAACSQAPAPAAPAAPTVTAAIAAPAIIPQPVRLDVRKGSFRVDAATPVVAASPEAKAAATYFVDTLKRTRGLDLKLADAAAALASGDAATTGVAASTRKLPL